MGTGSLKEIAESFHPKLNKNNFVMTVLSKLGVDKLHLSFELIDSVEIASVVFKLDK